MSKPYLTKPCDGKIKCPFRRDCMKGWLGKERMKEIIDSESFVCHKDHTKQCAGYLQFHKNIGSHRPLYFRVGFNQNLLQSEDIIFNNENKLLIHHDIGRNNFIR